MQRGENRDSADLFDAREVRFTETAGPAVSPALQSFMDGAWDEAVRANRNLFDGPVVLCTELHQDSAGRLVVSWARATYRYRVLRQLPDAPALSSVFVCVLQPTQDGRLLVGRMSRSTSSPGQLQFPGGIMEPPSTGQPLTVAALRRHAAAELVEEVGIHVADEELDLWLAARVPSGNVGFFFTAPALPDELVIQHHAALADAERARGCEPEFGGVALIYDAADLAAIEGAAADYLRPLVRRFLTADKLLLSEDPI
jgi:8-oxo-dGTP pyrophosphatase MutT (NUDIX family)